MPEEVGTTVAQPAHRKVFLSYAKGDRRRVKGLMMVLELGGAEVFIDCRSVRPGVEWEDRIARALSESDVLCVFWSAAAQRSKWVVAEYTTFLNLYPDRACVPLLTDATPLPAALAKRQAPPEFLALANELLALHHHFIDSGVSRREARRLVRRRLAESGLDLNERQTRMLLGVFATGVSLGTLLMPKLLKMGALLVTLIAATWLVTWRACSGDVHPSRTDATAKTPTAAPPPGSPGLDAQPAPIPDDRRSGVTASPPPGSPGLRTQPVRQAEPANGERGQGWGCGDGLVNPAGAGEQCDAAGGNDTPTCNGNTAGMLSCQISRCGDGYVNHASGEECEFDSQCPPTQSCRTDNCKCTLAPTGG